MNAKVEVTRTNGKLVTMQRGRWICGARVTSQLLRDRALRIHVEMDFYGMPADWLWVPTVPAVFVKPLRLEEYERLRLNEKRPRATVIVYLWSASEPQ